MRSKFTAEAIKIISSTPKYYCETAGEGIKKVLRWGVGKFCDRKLPLQERKSFTAFRKSVKKSLADTWISKCAAFFSRRVRRSSLRTITIHWEEMKKRCALKTTREDSRHISHHDVNMFYAKDIMQTLGESQDLKDISEIKLFDCCLVTYNRDNN